MGGILNSFIRLNGAILCFVSLGLLPGCNTPPAPTPSPMASGAATREPSATAAGTPAPSLRPTSPPPTPFPTESPTLGPSPRPTTECHAVDTPPPLSIVAGTNRVFNVVNRLVPDACILRSECGNPSLFSTVVAFFELVGSSVPQVRLRVTTADGAHGLSAALVVSPHIDGADSARAFCAGNLINPVTPDQAELLVSTGREARGLRQFLILAPSTNSGPLPNGSSIRLQMDLELCGGLQIPSFDLSAPQGTSLTFAARNQVVPASCPIVRCGQNFGNGVVSLVLRVSGHGSNPIRAIVGGGLEYHAAMLGSLTDGNAGCLRQLSNLRGFTSSISVNPNERFVVLAPVSGLTVSDGSPWNIQVVAP